MLGLAQYTALQWESKARYVLGYLVELDKIDRAIEGVEAYLTVLLKP